MSGTPISGDELDRLVEAAVAGDDGARSRLAARIGGVVERYLERSTGAGVRRYASVSDLRQEVLVDLDDLLKRVRPGGGWADVEALAVQRARWRLQKAARSRRGFVGESADGGQPGITRQGTLASEGAVTRADRLAVLRGQLDGLPPEQRDVVELRLADATFEEIGARLGVAESTVRYRFLTAIRSLRAVME